jgi:hypothetical protein
VLRCQGWPCVDACVNLMLHLVCDLGCNWLQCWLNWLVVIGLLGVFVSRCGYDGCTLCPDMDEEVGSLSGVVRILKFEQFRYDCQHIDECKYIGTSPSGSDNTIITSFLTKLLPAPSLQLEANIFQTEVDTTIEVNRYSFHC